MLRLVKERNTPKTPKQGYIEIAKARYLGAPVSCFIRILEGEDDFFIESMGAIKAGMESIFYHEASYASQAEIFPKLKEIGKTCHVPEETILACLAEFEQWQNIPF